MSRPAREPGPLRHHLRHAREGRLGGIASFMLAALWLLLIGGGGGLLLIRALGGLQGNATLLAVPLVVGFVVVVFFGWERITRARREQRARRAVEELEMSPHSEKHASSEWRATAQQLIGHTLAVIIPGAAFYLTWRDYHGVRPLPFAAATAGIALLILKARWGGPHRTTNAVAALMVVLGAVATIVPTEYSHHSREASRRQAARERAAELHANKDLHLSDTAVLTRHTLPQASVGACLFVTMSSFRMGLAAMPTTEIGGDNARWTDNHVWTDAEIGNVLTAIHMRVENRGSALAEFPADATYIVGESLHEARWWHKGGKYAQPLPRVVVPAGGQWEGDLLYAVGADEEGSITAVTIDLQALNSDQSRPIASWSLTSIHPIWRTVGVFTGTGGAFVPGRQSLLAYSDNPAYGSQTPQFQLTGARVRLKWTLRPYGYPEQGPYILVWFNNKTTGQVGRGILSDADLETDYYHTSSDTMEEKQGGRYVLQVLAANCRWRLQVFEERWVQ